ncbi:ABC transporter ATP-binding protein [Synechococcus elongatus]|uniref:ABC transporter ATP-binding protein n=1 Tax=Synechococcus elongatus PCC 11801 TaxID=2219813 RepID=A0AAN1QPQ4_SYNEL|nr:ABC transporter ATP-binding protein [Synechococcus elongatus]AZB73280.1 ABC transporter ATP-binding protein [Synechococcus elongatus PCC 11801]
MLIIENLYKQFKNGYVGLESISLAIQRHEIVTLIGTSGCGKSTLLRTIAGLEQATQGEVRIDHLRIEEPHPEIGVIFQEPRLMPWLNVLENVQFGLHHLPRNQRRQLASEALAKVGLSNFAQCLPHQLSGGMAQRVAIARALVTNLSILLLDEPFSALDSFTRLKLQNRLLEIWEYDRPTLILVTHDVEEALVLSDRIIVMRGNPGRIHQEITLDLPRPRKRSDSEFQRWKEKLLSALDLSDTHFVPAKV